MNAVAKPVEHLVGACIVQSVGAPGRYIARTADASLMIWNDIQAALLPIVGERGVEALCRRSLHLARTAHPWLVRAEALGAADGVAPAPSANGLVRDLVIGRTDVDAALAASIFLNTFRAVLADLLGAPLTERLLTPVARQRPAQEARS